MLLPGYAYTAVGIEKLGLPSLAIPNLFLPDKIGQFSVQYTMDRNGTPTPPSTPPQNTVAYYSTIVRRGSDPGIFSRAAIDGAVSYKSAVQGGAPGGCDGYGAPPRRINPKIVELIDSLQFAMEMKLTICPSDCASVNCSPFGSVSCCFFR